MEAREPGVYFLVVDNEARTNGLPLVEQAEDASDLLQAARDHFNESITTLTAERVLQEFSDERLSPRIESTEGFDPELFKAVVLFELSHIDADETTVAEYIQELARFWADPRVSQEDLEHLFTAPTKRARYVPFDAYSDFVIWRCIDVHIKDLHLHNDNDTPVDPLKDEIDGVEVKIMIGDRELKRREEHPVLTRQLMRDLRKLFPAHILGELKFRFPEAGEFEDINPLIEQIQRERSEKTLPSIDELLDMVQSHKLKGQDPLGLREDDEAIETIMQAYVETFRDISNRIDAEEVYLPAFKAWFVVVLLSSETEPDVYYRRIWHGDFTAEGADEVTPEEKVAVLEALKVEEEAFNKRHGDRISDEGNHIYDVYDSWGEDDGGTRA